MPGIYFGGTSDFGNDARGLNNVPWQIDLGLPAKSLNYHNGYIQKVTYGYFQSKKMSSTFLVSGESVIPVLEATFENGMPIQLAYFDPIKGHQDLQKHKKNVSSNIHPDLSTIYQSLLVYKLNDDDFRFNFKTQRFDKNVKMEDANIIVEESIDRLIHAIKEIENLAASSKPNEHEQCYEMTQRNFMSNAFNYFRDDQPIMIKHDKQKRKSYDFKIL